MDSLFVEYANPFLLLENIIQTGRFVEFINVFLAKRKERQRWEYYINKIPAWDARSWEQFNEDLDCIERSEDTTNEHLETTINKTRQMLNNFIPEERG